MLIRRLDVPFIGPQLMAFAVQRVLLEQLIAAYDRAVVDADNRGLIELWQTHVDRYAEERAGIVWRVPRATFVRIADSVRHARHVQAAPAPLRRRVDASLERAAMHFTGDGELHPPSWFDVENAYLSLLHPMARAYETFRDISLEGVINALDGLSVSAPEPPFIGPEGDLSCARALRFQVATSSSPR